MLNTHYKFLCRPCEESWWFGLVVEKQVLPGVPESLPWWHVSAGAPFELTAGCALQGAELTSTSPQLLSNRLINQYVCINFGISLLCASTVKAL